MFSNNNNKNTRTPSLSRLVNKPIRRPSNNFYTVVLKPTQKSNNTKLPKQEISARKNRRIYIKEDTKEFIREEINKSRVYIHQYHLTSTAKDFSKAIEQSIEELSQHSRKSSLINIPKLNVLKAAAIAKIKKTKVNVSFTTLKAANVPNPYLLVIDNHRLSGRGREWRENPKTVSGKQNSENNSMRESITMKNVIEGQVKVRDIDFEYIGEVVDGLFHGQGKKLFDDGRKFNGEFKHGIEEGYGELYDANGVLLQSGLWVNGKCLE